MPLNEQVGSFCWGGCDIVADGCIEGGVVGNLGGGGGVVVIK